MLETDDLTAMKDKELAKWHAEAKEAAPQFAILAENEWRMRSIREQHRLNKRVVIIAAIISALSGIFGGLVQRYIPVYHPSEPQKQIQPQNKLNRDINTEATKPLKAPRGAATTNELFPSQPPIKNEQKR